MRESMERNTAPICIASSRVGHNTSACIPPSGSMPCKIGSAYASVLPEPVGASAITSLPSNILGIASRCIAVAVSMFASASAARKPSFNSSKILSIRI